MELIRKLQRNSLHRKNCPMVEHYTKSGGRIEIKSFEKASEILKVPIENMLLLDDAPTWEHPHAKQIIQAEGFMAYDVDEDDYLNRLEITESMFPYAILEDGTIDDFKTNKIGVPFNDSLKITPFKNVNPKLGRSEPCRCGSGKKFKQCCI